MSDRWGFDSRDIRSALRHTIIPLVSGAAVAGLEAAQAGGFHRVQIQTAAITALIAGVIRLLQRWTVDFQKSP